MAEFFSVQDISISLGGRQILDHVSFSVDAPGHVIGLLGPNGSGKTTLLRALCGELPHDGHVFLEDTELAGLRPKELAKRVSYIPQQSGISISMSVLDVVLMGFYSKLGLLSQPSADMKAAALRALATIGMADLAERDYLTLSGGEKQLVILARTLVEDTKLLLFDEPDSSLDLGNKYRMVRMISELVHGRQNSAEADFSIQSQLSENFAMRNADADHSGKTALICLHDPVLALACCDMLMLLKDGRLICRLWPKMDSVKDMEKAFSEIYGPVRLVEISDPEMQDKTRLVLLPII